jgi:hypothetical protein
MALKNRMQKRHPAQTGKRSSSKGKSKQVVVKLQDVRLSFPNLFVPVAGEDDNGNEGKPTYSCHFLISSDHPQFSEVRKAMKSVALSAFGEDGISIYKELSRAGRVCLRRGSTKRNSEDNKVMDGYDGDDTYFISARTPTKPTVLDRDKSVLKERDGKPYGGCFVNCIIAIWAQKGKFGKRINAQLQGVQFVRDGDAFGSARAASVDDFDTLEDEFDGDDDTFGDDDDSDD